MGSWFRMSEIPSGVCGQCQEELACLDVPPPAARTHQRWYSPTPPLCVYFCVVCALVSRVGQYVVRSATRKYRNLKWLHGVSLSFTEFHPALRCRLGVRECTDGWAVWMESPGLIMQSFSANGCSSTICSTPQAPSVRPRRRGNMGRISTCAQPQTKSC